MTRTELKNRLLATLSRHIGRSKAIGMAALYEDVFGEGWRDKVNDTRELRRLITELRKEGVPICSVTTKEGGGYYLASAGSELEAYCSKLRTSALKKLALEAKLRNITLPELLGQLTLSLTGGNLNESGDKTQEVAHEERASN